MEATDPAAAEARAVAQVVILPAAGDAGVLDYAVPEAMRPLTRAGMRVLVPLGRRQAVGIIVATAARSAFPKLRSLLSLLDEGPVLDAGAMRLCQWLADYYLCSLGEAITTALPGSVRLALDRVVRALPEAGDGARLTPEQQELLAVLADEGEATVEALVRRLGAGATRAIASLRRRGLVATEQRLRGGGDQLTRLRRFYRIRRRLGPAEAATWERRRPKQYEIYRYLAQHPLGRAPASELHGSFDNLTAKLRALQKEGLVGIETEEFYRPVLPEDAPVDRAVRLNDEQNIAVAAIVGGDGFRPYLLWGVTGSGKTEVYLNAIADVLARGRTALVLVPEISLTHQLVDRVRARFGDGEGVAILHSGLSDGERWDEWRRIARGEVAIVVGARSAVFAPLPRLGLIVVDEEHDPSYKQDDGIRYNGRDVAVVRARIAACAAVLGSATPSMETFHNARLGRYTQLRLGSRVAARPLPAVEIVDMRRQGTAGRGVALSPRLVAALEANIAARAQSLLFLNRRGFSNFLQCHQCGEPLACPNCSVTLTLHRAIAALRCHHCDYTVPIPGACPACGGLSLGAWGAGTEQVEAALQEILPQARIARMDRDTTSRKGAQREILAAWERREYDVLIGTQMVTKGHDVHGVTLVGVLMADLSLNFPDFRAAERTFQLVAQVAGRAGRGDRPGRVVVQTFQPDHESLQCAEHHDFAAFAEIELGHRRELLYPPFSRMALLRCEGESLEATERIANDLRDAAAASGRTPGAAVMITGPAPAPLEKLRRRHRWQLLLRAPSGGAVRRAARYARDSTAKAARAADVRVIVDIDPYGML